MLALGVMVLVAGVAERHDVVWVVDVGACIGECAAWDDVVEFDWPALALSAGLGVDVLGEACWYWPLGGAFVAGSCELAALVVLVEAIHVGWWR